MERAELPTDADFQQTKQLKTTTAALEDLYVPSRPLSSSTTWFLFRQPSLSLFYLLFSFPLVSYTLLLLGESDGGLVPRHREEQDDLAGTAPYLKTCARDQSVDWRDCASASTVFKQATPSLVPKHLLLLEDDPAARSPPQTSFVHPVYILPVRPSVRPSFLVRRRF